ncbi:MAG: hypothetical protein AAGJ46_07980 [Planctomycetota bacterium]
MPVKHGATAQTIRRIEAAIKPGRTYSSIGRELGVEATLVAKVSRGEHFHQQTKEEQRRLERRCRLTPELAERVLGALEAGEPASVIAAEVGVTVHKVRRLLLKSLAASREASPLRQQAKEGNESYAPSPEEIEAQCVKLRLLHVEADADAWTPPDVSAGFGRRRS